MITNTCKIAMVSDVKLHSSNNTIGEMVFNATGVEVSHVAIVALTHS